MTPAILLVEDTSDAIAAAQTILGSLQDLGNFPSLSDVGEARGINAQCPKITQGGKTYVAARFLFGARDEAQRFSALFDPTPDERAARLADIATLAKSIADRETAKAKAPGQRTDEDKALLSRPRAEATGARRTLQQLRQASAASIVWILPDDSDRTIEQACRARAEQGFVWVGVPAVAAPGT